MIRLSLLTAISVAVMVAVSALPAPDITWARQSIEQRATLRDTELLMFYEFTNAGEFPIRFLKVEPSCGCTTIGNLKDSYLPGETGMIAANLDVQRGMGWEEKTIRVVAGNAELPTSVSCIQDTVLYTLIFKVFLPRVLIQPQILRWNHDTQAQEKELVVTIVTDSPAGCDLQAEDPGSKFSIIKTRVNDNRFKITIAPHSPNSASQSVIRLRALIDGETREFYIPVIVN